MLLDNIDDIKKLDPSNVYGSILALPDQAKQAWEEASQLELPENYLDFDNVVFAGMGGSNLGFRLLPFLVFASLGFSRCLLSSRAISSLVEFFLSDKNALD